MMQKDMLNTDIPLISVARQDLDLKGDPKSLCDSGPWSHIDKGDLEGFQTCLALTQEVTFWIRTRNLAGIPVAAAE